jgi:hypothetical protein
MRSSLASLLGGSAVIVALASCSVNPAAAVCNSVPLKSVAIPQLIYPVPGYAKVPDNAAFIVVAYPDAPSLAQTITLSAKAGASQSLGPMGAAPPQIPTPHAKVLAGQGTEYGVTLPKLSAKTTYTVAYRYANSANLCGQSTTASTTMGSFTTL